MVNKNRIILFLLFIVFALDRIIKNYIVDNVKGSIPIINNFFNITYIENYGVGFGLLQNQAFFVISVSLIVLGAIIYYYKDIPKKPYVWVSVGLIIGGTLGNLFDRIMFGFVIDYLDFIIWPVFNLADTALVIGVVLLIIHFWHEDK